MAPRYSAGTNNGGHGPKWSKGDNASDTHDGPGVGDRGRHKTRQGKHST